MQAKETRLQEIIEGTKQYVIPLFQRSYSWDSKEWKVLWNDIEELAELEKPRVHFMGSIVNMPTTSVPHGVAKYLLIDGQQRLTTISIILVLLRNKAHETGNNKLGEKIHNTLLVNPYENGNDFYKLLPTQIDRHAYQQIIDTNGDDENRMKDAYFYFEKRLKTTTHDLEKILKVITDYLSVVSIVLDVDDNPYLVFESLNAKGRTLTQADLIKNYFFMRISQTEQEDTYRKYWLPMQAIFTEDEMPEFIRHYMMKEGGVIRKTDVYYALKERVSIDNAIHYIQDLNKFSLFYRNIIYPEYESNEKLKRCFVRLNRIKQRTTYPLLLFFYGEYDQQKITLEEFVELLRSLESYLIRRFVCDYKSNELTKIFSTVYSAIHSYVTGSIVESFRAFLTKRGYPKDSEFESKLISTKMYGAGDRTATTKFILESIEESYHHKEKIDMTNLTIEHIMPQTLSVKWQNYLGEGWEDVHEKLLNTLGNLTLTGYNTELSNDDFETKQIIYAKSHLELNKYLADLMKWNRDQIEQRSSILANEAIKIWPYYIDGDSTNTAGGEVINTTPYNLELLGAILPVKNWRDVFEQTLNTLADLEPEKFAEIAQSLSSYVGKDKNRFRAIRQLNNGYYIEVNQSAPSIRKNCLKAIQIVGLSPDDWVVNYSTNDSDASSNCEPLKTSPAANERLNSKVKDRCVERVSQHFGKQLVKYSNSVYMTSDKSIGFYFAVSKTYKQPYFDRYWFGYRKKEEFAECRECYYIFGCGDEKTIILLSEAEIDKYLQNMNDSIDNETGETRHWHVVFTIGNDKRIKWVLAKPQVHDIDITDHLL